MRAALRVATHGEAPADLPPVHGRVSRVRMLRTVYVQDPAGSSTWVPAEPVDVLLEDLDAAPKWFPDDSPPDTPQATGPVRLATAVLVDLDVTGDADRA